MLSRMGSMEQDWPKKSEKKSENKKSRMSFKGERLV
jgi:hypothetical protein